jgi:hypothetical protein
MNKLLRPEGKLAMIENLATVAAVYLKMRDKCAAINKTAEADVAAIKAQMITLESVMLSALTQVGADSIRTESGTIYKEEILLPSAEDWQLVYAWIKENDTFEFLHKRITADAVKSYIDQNGTPPPGVRVHREWKAHVRRK